VEQRIGPLGSEDLANIEVGGHWVRDHFTPESRHRYEQLSEKLRLLQTILDAGWIEASETNKLQCLGITLGDALVQELGMEWVMVEDENGRDPAIRFPGTTVVAFPLTMISKRIEDRESIDVADLFSRVSARLREHARNPDYQLQMDLCQSGGLG
jgi:hypothetical protein